MDDLKAVYFIHLKSKIIISAIFNIEYKYAFISSILFKNILFINLLYCEFTALQLQITIEKLTTLFLNILTKTFKFLAN